MRSSLLLLLTLLQDPSPPETGTSACRPLPLDGATAEQRELLARYETTDKEFPWSLARKKETKKWTLYRVTFPSARKSAVEENDTVHGKYWRPNDGKDRHPAVLLLHWLGGSFEMMDLLGSRFAERGACALMIYFPHYGPRRAKDKEKREAFVGLDIEKTVDNFRQAVLDVRRAGDWLASRPEVVPDRIGMTGISLGAVIGSLATGVDPRFDRVAFLIGGGDLAGIVMNSSPEVDLLRSKVVERGWTVDELRTRWKHIEPLTFASRIRPEGVLMVNAETDEIIPKECTTRLQEAIGVKTIDWFPGGHYAIGFQLGKILPKVLGHFLPPPGKTFVGRPVLGERTIRVLVAEGAESALVESEGPVDVMAERDVVERLPGPLRLRIRADGDGIAVGATRLPAVEVSLRVEEGRSLRLGEASYPGELRFVRRGPRLDAVNDVELETYVAGVLGPEIGMDAPVEALRAQAVCVRTYALAEATTPREEHPHFDVYGDTRDQVYRGDPGPASAASRAAVSTKGFVLAWRGRPFKTYFHSTCGGRTESPADWLGLEEIPPLAGVECGFCSGAKHFEWTEELDGASVAEALGVASPVRSISVSDPSRSGRARKIRVEDGRGREREFKAAEFRLAVGPQRCRSLRFTVRRRGGSFVLSGHGWGHGVGLCQEGAREKARRGEPHEAILRHYYPGAEIRRLAD